MDWDVFLNEVEATQLDQAAALECLARHHGLKCVLLEGLTDADMQELPDRVAQLREAQKHLLELKTRLAETRQLQMDFPQGK